MTSRRFKELKHQNCQIYTEMRNDILSCYFWLNEWRKMTEQTDWRRKQPSQRACVSEDDTLKCWGAWDTTSHPPSPGGGGRRREYARLSSLKLRERAIISHRSAMLQVHRNRTDYWGRGAQDGHLDFHTAPELWLAGQVEFNAALRPWRP